MYSYKIVAANTKRFVDELKTNEFRTKEELKRDLVFGFVVTLITQWIKYVLDGAPHYECIVYVTMQPQTTE